MPGKRRAHRILLTNDDGIYAEGLWALARCLQDLGQVIVVAPDREQSATSSAVTLHHPLRATQVMAPIPEIKTWAVEGTPADCVILALGALVEGPVHLVVAGINNGANLGADTLLSGTVAAALQGHFRGIPSFAVSMTAVHRVRYETGAAVAHALAAQILQGGFPRDIILNVNVPNRSLRALEGMRVTRLASRTYMDLLRQGNDGKRRYFWIKRGKPEWKEQAGTDIWAIRHKMVSVTPLSTDLSDGTRNGAVGKLALAAETTIWPKRSTRPRHRKKEAG
jgi:5'-nucleotidase